MESFFLQLFIFIFFAALLAYWVLISQYESDLQRLCRDLEPGTFQKISSKEIFGTRTYRFESRRNGRFYRIDYRYRPDFERHTYRRELEIQIPLIQKFWLRLVRVHDRNLGTGLVTGNEDLDSRFLINSNQPGAAAEFLNHPYISDQLRMLRFLFARLEIHRGWLRAAYTDSLERSDFEAAIDALFNMVLLYENQAGSIRLVELESVEACPYCREPFAASDVITECAHCGTRLHEPCWKANGQCTTWGCASGERVKE